MANIRMVSALESETTVKVSLHFTSRTVDILAEESNGEKWIIGYLANDNATGKLKLVLCGGLPPTLFNLKSGGVIETTED